jgi:hypothetical protein
MTAPAADKIDEAIEETQVPAGATHMTLNVKLPGDRGAVMVLPIGINPVDVFLLTDILHQHLREQPQPSAARSRLVLPR